MSLNGIVRCRTLPHIDVDGQPTFITACLRGSINNAGLKRIRRYRGELNEMQRPQHLSEAAWEMKKHKLVFSLVDSLLDHSPPVRHLANDQVAGIVRNAFLHFAEERYHLYAFVIMPSHHHWLFLPKQDWSEQFAKSQAGSKHRRTPREAISHSIQSYTGTQCNRLLGLSGAFWQTETYDHFVRNDDEFHRILHYIEQNPVAADLAATADDFRWSSANLRRTLGLQPGDAIPNRATGFQTVSLDRKPNVEEPASRTET